VRAELLPIETRRDCVIRDMFPETLAAIVTPNPKGAQR
jgi:hypothetical protein